MTLTPAYGRDYKSKAAVLEDFNNNKDFVINSMDENDGRYVNKEQLQVGTQVTFRYKKLRDCFVHTV